METELYLTEQVCVLETFTCPQHNTALSAYKSICVDLCVFTSRSLSLPMRRKHTRKQIHTQKKSQKKSRHPGREDLACVNRTAVAGVELLALPTTFPLSDFRSCTRPSVSWFPAWTWGERRDAPFLGGVMGTHAERTGKTGRL